MISKEKARQKVINCAKLYQKKLLNKKLLVIYRERTDNTLQFIEICFYERNYQHLTGIELIDEKGNKITGQSRNFFRKCLNGKLSLKEIQFKKDGTTPLKLSALEILMDVTKVTKITGNYNGSRPKLVIDKIIGGVKLCLGLANEGKTYVPASALAENAKTLIQNPSQVLAIFEKDKNDTIYSTIKHVAKGLNLNTLTLPQEINNIISLESYVYKGK